MRKILPIQRSGYQAIEAGSALNAKVLTNDYNLNKVAEFQGVTVLNIK